jgi:hypothetical protein
MTVWGWIAIGAFVLMGVSLLVGLAIARILGTISDEISQLLDEDAWSSAPLARAIGTPQDAPMQPDGEGQLRPEQSRQRRR